jgi:hypothetical protein
MASTKARTSSPFRFRKPASVNGKLPGFGGPPMPSSSSSQNTGPSSITKSASVVGRSLTPNRARNALLAAGSNQSYNNSNHASLSIAPQRSYRVSSTASPAASATSPSTPTSQNVDYLAGIRAKENVAVTVRFRPLK